LEGKAFFIKFFGSERGRILKIFKKIDKLQNLSNFQTYGYIFSLFLSPPPHPVENV